MININQNFTKYVGSKSRAVALVNKIAEQYNDHVYSSTQRRVGRLTLEVYGKTKNFLWRYYPEFKTVSVTYTDGRPQPEEVTPKNTYYIIWVEGLSAKRGEKVKSFTADGIKYTLKMSDALRIKKEDIHKVKTMLRDRNIAVWVIDSPSTFHKTNYAPKGTLLK